MMTRSAGPDRARQAALTYLTARLDKRDATAEMGDKKRGPQQVLEAMCRNFGTEDGNGNLTWLLDPPVTIDGITYTGFRLQARQPASYWDEEPAQEFIRGLPPELQEGLTHTEIVYDYDQLYLLVQQQHIAAHDIDSLIVTPPREFALTVLEAK